MQVCPLTPILDNVIVEIPVSDEQVIGGIVIPDKFARGPNSDKVEEATVLAVGPGRVSKKGALCPPEVSPGDKVLINRFMGTELGCDGRRLVVVPPKDILGVLE